MKDDKTKEKDFAELKDEDLDKVAGGTDQSLTLPTLDQMIEADKNKRNAQVAQVTEEAYVEETEKVDDIWSKFKIPKPTGFY